MTKKTGLFLITVSTLLIMAITVAVSYAYWTVTRVQETTNVISSGCFDIRLSEETNLINLQNTYPLTDTEGEALTPYSFTITNTCDIYADYTVNLEVLAGSDLSTGFVATKVNNGAIKTLNALPNASVVEEGSVESRTIATGGLDASKSITYDLRLWLDEDVTLDDDAQNKNFTSKIVISAQAAEKPFVCKRATTLHTETCTGSGCRNSGFATDAVVTYGNTSVTAGTLNAGDAFTCDVNNDGTYDEVNERFYYVSDVFDTVNSTETELKYDSETAALIYYNNVFRDNGVLTINNNAGTAFTAYDGEMAPTMVLLHLPKTSEWVNVSLKNATRQIRQANNGLVVSYGSNPSLPTFTYTNSAARLLTVQEARSACGLDASASLQNLDSDTNSKCRFLFENTPYALTGLDTYGYWLETYAFDNPNRAFYVYGSNRQITNTYVDYSYPGARPVIEVSKTDIEY